MALFALDLPMRKIFWFDQTIWDWSNQKIFPVGKSRETAPSMVNSIYNQLRIFLNVQDMSEISPLSKKIPHVKSYINAGFTCGIFLACGEISHIKKYVQRIIIIILYLIYFQNLKLPNYKNWKVKINLICNIYVFKMQAV
ncbi:unnamed protein product [Blepharisma stoltei]|uniref:Uncharacterized protein n=1 Tax=Blepharisma stoltei TaxID=1481888 RepID=A0AAU9IDV0_9CILI|nr:unnamed protein product [Blepharisma stoltei]